MVSEIWAGHLAAANASHLLQLGDGYNQLNSSVSLPYTLTGGSGSPAGSMMFYVMYLYQNAFLYLKMGYASAMAWILFIVIALLTVVIFIFIQKMGSLSGGLEGACVHEKS